MPAFPNHTGCFGVPNVSQTRAVVRSFSDGTSPVFEERNYTITGVTRDSTGVALAGVTVDLFYVSTNTWVATVVSDASGNYSFNTSDKASLFFTREYLSGSPDRAGTSLNTLVAA